MYESHSKKRTICLNMIVKNEKHIIKETLDNLCKYIDFSYWVISDTGSSDGTQEFIKNYFKEKQIEGELFEDEWIDFASNRNKAMHHAFNKSDYIFFFDADDLIHGNFALPDKLDKNAYRFKFGTDYCYHRICLITNREKIAKYIGVLHEILTVYEPSCTVETINGNYYFESRRLGDRSKNPYKYEHDGLVLQIAFENEKSDLILKYRYAFYCAQSYQDAKLYEKSIKWYKLFLDLPTTNQYKYCACINLGHVYKILQNTENSLYYFALTSKYDSLRIEGITYLMEYYYYKNLHFMVNALWHKFKNYKIHNYQEKIFLNYGRYDMFEWYNIVSGFYANDIDSGYESCKISVKRNINIPNVLANLIFYKEQLKSDSDSNVKQFLFNYIYNNRDFKLWKKYGECIKHCSIQNYNILYNKFERSKIHKSINYKSSKNILIYTGYMNILWNDSTLKDNSLGGSEKAVIYLSRKLPKNYKIYIAGHQKEETLDNIEYINHKNIQPILDDTIFHTVIVSRWVSFFEDYTNIKCYKLILSAHDICFLNYHDNISLNSILISNYRFIDHIVCLTNWHKKCMLDSHMYIKNKIKLINNGLNIEDFNKGDINGNLKIKNKFVWSSCAYRGLDVLLDLWPSIVDNIPDATLDICSYDTFPKDEYEMKMKEIIDNNDNITHHGKLNTSDLYDLMNKCEYWLYTTTFTETSCITSMEMLMNNVICLYYPIAGLVDTLGDYGIKVEKGNEIETIMNLNDARKDELRKKGKEYALLCSWENRAKTWSNLLELERECESN